MGTRHGRTRISACDTQRAPGSRDACRRGPARTRDCVAVAVWANAHAPVVSRCAGDGISKRSRAGDRDVRRPAQRGRSLGDTRSAEYSGKHLGGARDDAAAGAHATSANGADRSGGRVRVVSVSQQRVVPR
jgi:hypothetical protein